MFFFVGDLLTLHLWNAAGAKCECWWCNFKDIAECYSLSPYCLKNIQLLMKR